MQIYFITSRQVLYTIGINPNIYRQIPQIYHGNYSGGNYLPTLKKSAKTTEELFQNNERIPVGFIEDEVEMCLKI